MLPLMPFVYTIMLIVFTLFNVYWFGRVLHYCNKLLLDLPCRSGLRAPVPLVPCVPMQLHHTRYAKLAMVIPV